MPKAFCSNAGLPGSFTKALSYDEQIQFLIDKYNKMADVVNNLDIESKIDYVAYEPQSKTDLQKQQATENIGAVSTIANQILDEDEQMNARENINAMEYEAKDDFVKAGGAVVYDENFTNILPNTNLATITYCEPGRYYCADVTGITGFSAAMPFEMEVFKVNSNLVRRYFQYDNGRKYVQEVELNPLKFYAVVDFGGFNVSYLLQDLTEDQKAQARENIGAGTGSAEGAVLFTPQSLTDSQKAQARENIGAGTGSGSAENAVLYTSQTLNDTEKNQARANIDAARYDRIRSTSVTLVCDPNFSRFSCWDTNGYVCSLGIHRRTGENFPLLQLFGSSGNSYNEILTTETAYKKTQVDTAISNATADCVLTTAQTLTDTQKEQARNNIGITNQIQTDIVTISDIYTIDGTPQITFNSIKSYKINNLITCHIDMHVIAGQTINANTSLFKLNILPATESLIPLYYYTSHSTPYYRYILCELETSGHVENKLPLNFGTGSTDGNIVLNFTYATT